MLNLGMARRKGAATISVWWFMSVVFLYTLQTTNAQISTSELEDENAAEVANRTYVEEQTELQREILGKYNKRSRPVRNESEPVEVSLHVYLMHVSINQMEQTLILNGHIYMTWKDEFAVWEPSEHNGVRTTMVKQWEVWTPELRITNSVSGVGQYFEISKRSYVIIHSNGKDSSRVEVYPTFSIKIGCAFDYSAYPFDTQKCALGIFTTARMSEVQLSIYYNLNPTVLLGWGEQQHKQHISDWKLEQVYSNLTFFYNGRYTSERLVEPYQLDISWSVVHTWLCLRRNAFHFGVAVLLPSIISYLFILFSFLMPSPDAAIYLLISNFVFLGVFLEDLVSILPPTVGRAPRIAYFTGFILVLTTLSLGAQFWLRYMLKARGEPTGWLLYLVRVKELIPKQWLSDAAHVASGVPPHDEENQTVVVVVSWREVVDYTRIQLAAILLLLFFISLIALYV